MTPYQPVTLCYVLCPVHSALSHQFVSVLFLSVVQVVLSEINVSAMTRTRFCSFCRWRWFHSLC